MSNLQTCWRQTVCQNRLRTASTQGVAALAVQGSVAPLTERSDETFSVMQFSSADGEWSSARRTTLDREYRSAPYPRTRIMRPLVPKGILSVRQTGKC